MIEPSATQLYDSAAVQMTFEELIYPVDRQQFFERYWDRQHLIISRNNPSYYGSLFSASDVDRAIAAAREVRQDNLTLIPPPDSGRKLERFLPVNLPLAKAYQAFCQGDTVRLMAVHRTWPPLTALAESLEAELSSNVNINFYLTPPGKQGFSVHVDTHDVFVLQVEGSKEWFIYEWQYPLPVYTLVHEIAAMKAEAVLDETSLKLIDRVVLRQGDFLYMPRGVPHKAVASDEHSLHLTVGIHALYWVDFMKALVEAASLSYEPLRRSIPPGFARDADLVRTMEETLDQILGQLRADPPLSRVYAKLSDSAFGKQQFPADGHFAALLALNRINPESLMERRGSLFCRVERNSSEAVIRFGENQVKGPASIGPALEFIGDSLQFRVRELPGAISSESKVVLVRRLVREGLLRPV